MGVTQRQGGGPKQNRQLERNQRRGMGWIGWRVCMRDECVPVGLCVHGSQVRMVGVCLCLSVRVCAVHVCTTVYTHRGSG